jgi:hypothetical protein
MFPAGFPQWEFAWGHMTNKKNPSWLMTLLPLGLLALPAHAVVIEFDVSSLGGHQYQYNYTVTNDGSITPVLSLFDIDFDANLYDELSLLDVSEGALSSDWSQIFLGSGIGIPAAFDVLALNGGLSTGATVAGFAVQFTWLGTGTPGAQSFSVYDAESFELLGGSSTVQRLSTSVPEPGTLGLTIAALAGLWRSRRKRTD